MFKRESNKKLCEEVLHEVAKRHNIKITKLSVMSNHIHIVVIIPVHDGEQSLKILEIFI